MCEFGRRGTCLLVVIFYSHRQKYPLTDPRVTPVHDYSFLSSDPKRRQIQRSNTPINTAIVGGMTLRPVPTMPQHENVERSGHMAHFFILVPT